MTAKTAAQAFADATSALTREHDIADVLARLVRDCAQLLSAGSIGVLVSNPTGELELLSSTSHDPVELRLFQSQEEDGPCADAVRTAEIVEVSGAENIAARWLDVGPAIVEAGY